MRVAKVLLRWYKSFNLNYMNYSDRRSGIVERPWNQLTRPADEEDVFRFIEISLEDDITTIVGGNESGKSHLLSAISQVLIGKGIPSAEARGGKYSRTDLCHYTSPRSKNAEDWPHIGLQFDEATADEIKNVLSAAGVSPARVSDSSQFTLILAPDNAETVAYLYIGTAEPHALSEESLNAVREYLPRVEFIKSDLGISDQVPITSLLSAYGEGQEEDVFDYKVAQEVASFIRNLTVTDKKPQIDEPTAKKIAGWRTRLNKARLTETSAAELECRLFRDVLGIKASTLKFVASLRIDDRTHADSLIERWNKELDEQLNLSHYWQQDDSFALRINYKQGVLYFEITDKTGATYTFHERSSGLKYFLSYYIQAKALELTSRDRNTIVLMDEPDSFLSIIGQRNLLAVFESLVRSESSDQACQLVYTTHSPFLINRNYPRRLRLVRKGDAEEGTQLIDEAMLRRYEPVRSALGIDCSQTLFMGATNVVVEGPTDQYLLAELVRRFITPENVSELLDLNALVLVSAESAPSVEKVLAASQWGDEPIPATVVFLDSDEAGDTAKARITGQGKQRCKKLIEEEFVLQIGSVITGTHDTHKIVTIEDLLPPKLFAEAVRRYVERWHPKEYEENVGRLKSQMDAAEFAKDGLAAGTTKVLNELVHEAEKGYDKMGVLQEVVKMLHGEAICTKFSDDLKTLENRLLELCRRIRRAVSASQQAARRATGKQAIQRLIDDYFKTHKQSSSVFEIELLLERIRRESQLLGEDGEKLDVSLGRLFTALEKIRASAQKQVEGDDWDKWKRVIQAIRENPLDVEIVVTPDGPIPAEQATPLPESEVEEKVPPSEKVAGAEKVSG